MPHVDRVPIHAEPMQRAHWRYATPQMDPSGTLSEHFGEAPYSALVRVRSAGGTTEERQVVANAYLEEERAKGIQVAERLVAQKVDVVLAKANLHGTGPVYVLRDAGVELRQTDAGTLFEALAAQWVSQAWRVLLEPISRVTSMNGLWDLG